MIRDPASAKAVSRTGFQGDSGLSGGAREYGEGAQSPRRSGAGFTNPGDARLKLKRSWAPPVFYAHNNSAFLGSLGRVTPRGKEGLAVLVIEPKFRPPPGHLLRMLDRESWRSAHSKRVAAFVGSPIRKDGTLLNEDAGLAQELRNAPDCLLRTGFPGACSMRADTLTFGKNR